MGLGNDLPIILRSIMRRSIRGSVGVGGLVFLLMGLIFSCIGGGFGVFTLISMRDKLTCQGVVVGFNPQTIGNQSSLGRVKTVPEVKYTLAEKSYIIRGKIASTPPGYSKGDSVLVYYPADNPENGFVGSFLELWLIMTIFGAMGVVDILVGCGIFFYGLNCED